MCQESRVVILVTDWPEKIVANIGTCFLSNFDESFQLLQGRSRIGWLVVLRIYVALAVFQPYRDLEAGDNKSLKIQVARPGIEPRISCSANQEVNHSICHPDRGQGGYLSRRSPINWQRTLNTCFLSIIVKIHSAVADEKLKICQTNSGHGCHLG